MGSALIGVDGDIGKGKNTALEEDHQEIQQSGIDKFTGSNKQHSESKSNNDSEDRSLHASNEVGEAPPNDLVVIIDNDDGHHDDHENDESVSVFGICFQHRIQDSQPQKNHFYS